MTVEVSFDYETFSACDIDLGSWRYAEDPSTRLLCFSYAIGTEKPRRWDVLNGGDLQDLFEALRAGALFWAFNTNFERAVTELVAPRHKIILPIKPHQYRDTQALCAMTGVPLKLEDAGAYLKTEAQKDKEGKALLKRFASPQKDGSRIMPASDPVTFKRLVDYCDQDVLTEMSVRAALPIQHLPPYEQRVWQWDSSVNRRGVKIDVPFVTGAAKLVQIAEEREVKKLIKVTGGKMTTANQGARAMAIAAAEGYSLPNFQAPTVAAALADPSCPPITREICRVRASIGMASTKKYAAAAAAVCRDGRVKNSLRYHKAHTGRWTGTIVQFQNLPRPRYKLNDQDRELIRNADWEVIDCLFPSLMALLRDAVRNMMVAPEGKTLTVVDEASIEARTLGWMCDEPFYQTQYAKGVDLYIVMAAIIYGVPEADVTKLMRALGKESVLGLGYSMWVDTFMANCAKKGLILPREMFERAVRIYRKNCLRVVASWKHCEDTFAQVILDGKPRWTVKCLIERQKGFLTARLPSGRRIWYPNPTCKMGLDKYGKMKSQITYDCRTDKGIMVRGSLYGGLIIENLDQGIARDILVDCCLRVESELKIPIVSHSHDEGIWETSTSMVKEVEELMKIPPPWAPGIILGAEGFSSPFYMKG